MRQIVQNLGSGATLLLEVPAPALQPGTLLIRSTQTLISVGTERMLVDFGRANWIEKARQQPEKVRTVLNKVRAEGLLTTLDAVKSKLDQPLPLGYCNAGVVMAVGAGVEGFAVGDRVVSNGPHADVVRVPRNLCARIPDAVPGEDAAYTVLASIGLQGIRLVAPTLGETVVVIGLGLIGLVTVQLLRAHGCDVIGVDFDEAKLTLAREFGAATCNLGTGEDPVAAVLARTGSRGADAVLITAATSSSEPVSQAARMSRKRGRIVLVGVTGLELKRSEFYEKELSFQVSCSYGPGRYDPDYEQKGRDYPFGFVRWTEQRNFEAVLSLMADGRLDVKPLTTHRFAFDECLKAYELLTSGQSTLGVVIEYPQAERPDLLAQTVSLWPAAILSAGEPNLAVIGAGNYASRVLIPALAKAGATLHTIVNSGGVAGAHHGRKQGFARVTTDPDVVFGDDRIDTVVVETRHDSHAHYAIRAIEAGKHVFVEKPLALTLDELSSIERARRIALEAGREPRIMVGFNRRFSPLVVHLKRMLDTVRTPKAFIYTVNAGAIPPGHWTQDPDVGGGRVIGEACHFIDLLRHLCGHPITRYNVTTMGGGEAVAIKSDKAMLALEFADGSIGTIHYLANGGKAFPKERIEVFANDAVAVITNFLSVRAYGWVGFRTMRLWRQDKGQDSCVRAFLACLREGHESPIPFDELLEVSRIAIELAQMQVMK